VEAPESLENCTSYEDCLATALADLAKKGKEVGPAIVNNLLVRHEMEIKRKLEPEFRGKDKMTDLASVVQWERDHRPVRKGARFMP
jgi:hypothetical protein